MPRIDPAQLLRTLGVLLAPNGGIKSTDEVFLSFKIKSHVIIFINFTGCVFLILYECQVPTSYLSN